LLRISIALLFGLANSNEADMGVQSTEAALLAALDEFRNRLNRLEQASRPRKKRFNQKEAAEYLNRSEEWLRREHAAGRGPKRKRRGSRGWEYTVEDLDAYAAIEAPP
jgi:hypothetical protein